MGCALCVVAVWVCVWAGCLVGVASGGSCFPDGATANLYCCSGSVEFDTSALKVTSGSTSKTCSAVSEGEHGVAECVFAEVALSGVTVTLKGTRALRLVSEGAMSLDDVSFDAGPDEEAVSGCFSSWQEAKLGGFDGGSGAVGRESDGRDGNAPSGLDRATGVDHARCRKGKCTLYLGGGGGSHFGSGGTSRKPSSSSEGKPGETYGSADGDLEGGGGGGGGSDATSSSTYSCRAHGGGGGGAIEFEARDGDLWVGKDAEIVANGGDSEHPYYGGAGGGGMVRFSVKGGAEVVLVKGAKVEAEGGYVLVPSGERISISGTTYYGEDVMGGGGIVAFQRISGTDTAEAVFEAADVSVASGASRCSSDKGASFCACVPNCETTDGAILYATGIEKSTTTTTPTSMDDAPLSLAETCEDVTAEITTSRGKCCWQAAGGQNLDVLITMPIGDDSRRIASSTKPSTYTIGGVACKSTSWINAESNGRYATARCSTPAGVGKNLDIVIAWNGGESHTIASGFSYKPPTISALSLPAANRRWTATASTSYTFSITGTHFGSDDFSDEATVTIGGRPCSAVEISSDTSMTCTVPANVGTGHTVKLTLAGQTATAATTFSYSAPEIHALSLAPNRDTDEDIFHDTAGGETLTILGVNFGAQYWDAGANAAKTMVASKIAVSLFTKGGTRTCASVQWVSDRKITCTTPAGSGQGLDVSVTVEGQTTKASESDDSRAYLKSTFSETDTFNNNVDEDDGYTASHPPTFAYSYPRLSSIALSTQSVSTSSSSPLLLDTAGGETITLTGSNFGPSSDPSSTLPLVYVSGVKATGVSRTSDTEISAVTPAGTGTGHTVYVVQRDLAISTAIGEVDADYRHPTITALSSSVGLKQGGGRSITVLGRYFGKVSSTPRKVFFGRFGKQCSGVTHNSGGSISCTTPAGTDENLRVVVEVDGQNSTETTYTVSYATPTISAIAPSYAFDSATSDVTFTFTITGTNLGATSDQFDKLEIGGVECADVTYLSSTSVRCNDMPANEWTSSHVVAYLGNQNSPTNNPLFTHIAAPSFFVDASTNTGPTDATTTLKLIASGNTLGLVSSDINWIKLRKGDVTYYTCGAATMETSGGTTTVSCPLPAGVGAEYSVDVQTKGLQVNSPNTFFSYRAPTITSIYPNDVPTIGGVLYNFTITGTDFGNENEHPTSAKVGGRDCESVIYFSSTEINCTNVPADGWKDTSVRVTVGGQEGLGQVFLFSGAPTVSGVTPVSASTRGGGWFNITGENLGSGGGTSEIQWVTLGGRDCSNAQSLQDGKLVICRLPRGVGRDLGVEVKTSDGLTAGADNVFSYIAPSVASVSPSTAVSGDLTYDFTIVGTNLAARAGIGGVADGVPLASEVSVGGVGCDSVEALSTTTLVCKGVSAASGFTTGDVVVTVGGQQEVATNIFTGFGRPVVLAVTPSEIQTDGEVNITLAGTDFGASISDIDSVTVGTRECLAVYHIASNQVICTAPPGAGKVNYVNLKTIGGLLSAARTSLAYSAPVITAASPSNLLTGPLLTYSVMILGENLASSLDFPVSSGVRVGGRVCDSVSVLNSSAIVCEGLSAASGWKDAAVQVTLDGQTGTNPALLSTLGAPLVTFATPSIVPVDGGVRVEISGLNFGWVASDIAKVTVGSAPCTNITLASSTSLTCVTPANTGSQVPCILYSRSGLSSPTVRILSYNRPTITAISPSFAVTGPNAVYDFVIEGLDLGIVADDLADVAQRDSDTLPTLHPSLVSVGGQECGSIVLHNSSVLECKGVSAASGWSSTAVIVETNGQRGTGNFFRYSNQPRVITVEPNTAHQDGGVVISIVGSDFGEQASDLSTNHAVTVGGIPCPLLTHTSTRLTCRLPRGTGTDLDVKVRNKAGLASEDNSRFSYRAPTITSITPNYVFDGALFATDFTIRGDNFGFNATHVDSLVIGGTTCPKPSIQVISGQEILCRNLTAPASSGYRWDRTSVDLSVSAQSMTQRNLLTVYRAPAVDSVEPRNGPTVGHGSSSNPLKIRVSNGGQRPTDVIAVTIDNKPCLSFNFLPDTNEVSCALPPGIGASVPIVVTTLGGLSSLEANLFSYDPPHVVNIVPSILYSGDVVYNVSVYGVGFGATEDGLTDLKVGGQTCTRIIWESDSVVHCEAVSAPWSSENVEVTVGEQVSADNSLVVAFDEPKLTIIQTEVDAAVGGYPVTLVGERFALQLEDITAVHFGDIVVPKTDEWEFSDDFTTLTVIAPPGQGRSLPVVVERVDGLVNDVGGKVPTFSYANPVLQSVVPSYALYGLYNASFSLHGLDLASGNGTLVAVSIGSVPCAQFSVNMNAGNGIEGESVDRSVHVECFGVVANQWSSNIVRLDLSDGRFFTFSNRVTLYNRPTITALAPAVGSTEGGTVVQVTGTGFGRVDDDVEEVWIGGKRATNITVLSATTLQLITPPGISAPLPIYLKSKVGTTSIPAPLWSYSRPLIREITPSYAFAFAPRAEIVAIRGENFGNKPSDLKSITIVDGRGEQVTCPSSSLVWRSSREVACQGNDDDDNVASEEKGFGSSLRNLLTGIAEVRVGVGNLNSSSSSTLFSLIGRPGISFITPTSGPTDSDGLSITLEGYNLGRVATDLIGVWVDGVPSPEVEWRSETQLRFILPPGAGAGVDVRVETLGGASPPNNLFTYSAPLVLQLKPDYALTGPQILASFNITGRDFGPSVRADGSALFVDSVHIGGSPCKEVIFHSSTHIECFDVNGTTWDSNSVEVVVAGQVSPRNSAFNPIGAPEVDLISPESARPGEEILILGSNFGFQPEELMKITIDGVPCTSITHRGSNAASCVVPPVRPELARAAKDAPSLLLGLHVGVQTLGPQINLEPNKLFGYTTDGDPPVNPPFGVLAWRAVGTTGSIHVRWFHTHLPEWAWYPTPERAEDAAVLRRFQTPPESFIAAFSSDPKMSNVTTQVILSDSIPITKVLDEDTLITAYQQTLVGFDRVPMFFRITARNAGGIGPYSNSSNPAVENCLSTEYLRTHFPIQNVSCAPCPRGAYCGGLDAENVTAKSGYWRIPWSKNTLEFAPCPSGTVSCFGYTEDTSTSSSSSSSSSTASTSSRRRRLLRGVDVVDKKALVQEMLSSVDTPFWDPKHSKTPPTHIPSEVLHRMRHHVSLWEAFQAADRAATASLSRELTETSSNTTSTPTSPLFDPDASVDAIRPSAVPGSSLIPSEWEKCDEGHDGVLCTRCKPGYARSGSFRCRQCQSTVIVVLTMMAIAVAVLAVISFVIRRTLRAKGGSSKSEIQLLKILFTHLQTISLVAGFDLEWPVTVTGFFTVVDVASSVNANVFSIDCLREEGSRGMYYSKTLLLLFTPIILIAFVSLFWVGRYYVKVCMASSRTRKTGRLEVMSDPNKTQEEKEAAAGAMLAAAFRRKKRARLAQEKKEKLGMGAVGIEEGAGGGGGGGGEEEVKVDDVLNGGGRARDDVKRAGRLLGDEGAGDGKQRFNFAAVAKAARMKSATWSHTRSRIIVSTVVILFLVHSTVTRAALALFGCTDVERAEATEGDPAATRTGTGELLDEERLAQADNVRGEPLSPLFTRDPTSERYDQGATLVRSYTYTAPKPVLVFDMDVSCGTTTSTLWQIFVGVPALAVYSVGIPATAAYIIFRNRDNLDNDVFRRHFGFLYAGYSQPVWESVVMARKVLFAAISVFLARYGQAIQVYAGILVLFVATVLEASMNPWSIPHINFASIVELAVSFLSLYCGLFLLREGAEVESSRVFATLVIVGANTIFLFFMIILLVRTTMSSMEQERFAVLRQAAHRFSSFRFGSSNPMLSSRSLTDSVTSSAKDEGEATKEESKDEAVKQLIKRTGSTKQATNPLLMAAKGRKKRG